MIINFVNSSISQNLRVKLAQNGIASRVRKTDYYYFLYIT
jgi:hypothetical protein